MTSVTSMKKESNGEITDHSRISTPPPLLDQKSYDKSVSDSSVSFKYKKTNVNSISTREKIN